MNLDELLKKDLPPEEIKLSQQDLRKFFIMYKKLQYELSKSTIIKNGIKLKKYHSIPEFNDTDKEVYKKTKTLRRNLKMAQRVQKAIINTDLMPRRKEFKLAYYYHPMDEVGGDLFDIIRVGKNKYGFLIADVSGHGVSAAMIQVLAKVYFNIYNQFSLDTGAIIKNVNSDLYKFLGDLEYYLTAFYGILNLETREFQFSNAGHHPAILFSKNKEPEELLNDNGIFIGISNEFNWETKKIILSPGDQIFFYTDGIIDIRNSEKEFYTKNRLIEFISKNKNLEIKALINKLVNEIINFTRGIPTPDDQAVMLLEYSG